MTAGSGAARQSATDRDRRGGGLRGAIRRFVGGRAGNVSMLTALLLPCTIGFAALAVEFSHGLLIKAENQRIADAAAYAGALAYASSSSTTTMAAAGQSIAALNGLSGSAASLSLVASSPRNSGNPAVMAVVSTAQPFVLAGLFNIPSSIDITATAYAEVTLSTSCLLALNASASGITLSGGTKITGSSCSVASNASIVAPCGTSVTATTITYGTTAPTVGCSGGLSGTVSKATTADPLAAQSAITAAAAKATAAKKLAAPTISTVSTGTDIAFDWSNSATKSAKSIGCTAAFSSSTWTLTCPSGGTYYFGAVTLGGGITVNFNTAGSSATTYNFSGTVNNSGTKLTFGPGTFNMAKGLITGGGSTTAFGAGTFNIGKSATSCNGGYYSVCNTGTSLTFGGPSSFKLTAGLYNGGGSTLKLGSGSTNSYAIGAGSDGNAIYVGGGATTTFADATGSSSVFEVVGNITSGGGACTTLPAATTHPINGNINMAGGLLLGSGLYPIGGYFGAGINGGGDVSCSGSNVGVSGTGVTIAVAGANKITSGSCSGSAFCIGAGFSNVKLNSPTSGTYAYASVVGPVDSSNTAGVYFTEGASSTTFGGAVYFPYGAMTLSGGASVVPSTCLQIVASQITVSGGTSITASSCFSSGSTASGPTLVQ
jgi:Flp pilus assembly protein TadG